VDDWQDAALFGLAREIERDQRRRIRPCLSQFMVRQYLVLTIGRWWGWGAALLSSQRSDIRWSFGLPMWRLDSPHRSLW